MAGGTQGVAVQAGAHLEATGLTISEVLLVGAEVQGQGSCLSLTGCKVGTEIELSHSIGVGVHVHSRSSDHLSSVQEWGSYHHGVRVASSAAAALDDCQVSECHRDCVHVQDSTFHLTSCTLKGSDLGFF